MAILVVGIVLLFVYAFRSNEKVNRQNWAKAQLIMVAIVMVLLVLFLIVFGSVFAATIAANS